MINRAQLATASRLVSDWKRVAILSHERPDGDAIGSMVALQHAMQRISVEAHALIFGNASHRYDCIAELGTLRPWQSTTADAFARQYDGIIVVDTYALNQLTPAQDILNSAQLPVLVIDHHVTRDQFADCELIDEQASSACLLVAEWVLSNNWVIDSTMARALYGGMATDTGWFRFPSTDSRTMSMASTLLDCGVEPYELYGSLYQCYNAARLRVFGEVFSSLQLLADGRLAVMHLTDKVLEQHHASSDDIDELINEPLCVASVKATVIFHELTCGRLKVGLRSKSGIDVAKLAERFGGGGHPRAAGIRISDPKVGVQEDIIKTLEQAIISRSNP